MFGTAWNGIYCWLICVYIIKVYEHDGKNAHPLEGRGQL